MNFRQASNHCKRVLEAAKLAYANKTKDFITSQKSGSHDFWRIPNSDLKGKSAIPPLFDDPDKAKLFAKKFLRTLILITQVPLSLFSCVELI